MLKAAAGQGLSATFLTILDNADRYKGRITKTFGPFPQRKRFTATGSADIEHGTLWLWSEVPIDSFAALAETLDATRANPFALIVPGRVRDEVRDRTKIHRLKNQQGQRVATIEDAGSSILFLDLDDKLPIVAPYGWHNVDELAQWAWRTVIDRVPALADVSVWWQASGSAGVAGKDREARFHFFALIDEPMSEDHLREVYAIAGADKGLASCNQKCLIADPEFDGVEDPLAGQPRTGVILGSRDRASTADLINLIPKPERKVLPLNRPKIDWDTSEDDIVSALNAIDPDLDYEDWLRVGMGLKAELGDRGFDLWDRWSAGGSKYDQRVMGNKWKSFSDSGDVTAGTIFHHAKQFGWERPEKPIDVPSQWADWSSEKPPPSAAIWKIKPVRPENRKRDTLIEVLSKVKNLDDIGKVLGVAVAQSNRAPHVMSGREVMAFLDEHLPKGVISKEWIEAIGGRIRWSLNKRKAQALAPTRFSAEMLSVPWIDHRVVSELSPLDQINGVVLLRAPMASGKTQRVGAPWIRDVKAALEFGDEVWAIAHRVSLIGEMTHRLDLAHYQRDGYQTTLEKSGAGICLPSITIEKYAKQKPEYVFVDEIRQVLEFLGAEAYCRTKTGTAADVFDRLVEIIRNAKGVLCADAGADDVVLKFLRMCRPDDQIRVVEMQSKPTEITGTFVTGEHAQDDIVAQAGFAMQIGAKVWFACEGTITAEAVGQELSKVGKVLVITADNKNDADQRAFLDDPEGQSRLYDAVVASPIISSGISIEHRDKPHFNAGFALFSGGAIRPTDAAQMLRRVRYLTDWTIGLTSLNRFGGCRAEDIIEGKIAAADLEGFHIDPSDFDKMVIGFEAEAMNQRGDFGAGLWWLLQDAGWTLNRHAVEGDGDLVKVKRAVQAQTDQQVIEASYWLTKAVRRYGEVRVANALENARRAAPAQRTRRRIDAWEVMDVIGLRKLEQDDLEWWRNGGRATATRYEDLLCRYQTIEVDQVTLAHRALRLARRTHYREILGDWDPLAEDAVLTDEVAQRAMDMIWPRRKEFVASGAVPEAWRNMKNKPTNAKAALRNVLLRCGLWFKRTRVTESHFVDSKIYGLEKSGTLTKSITRPWKWVQQLDDLALISVTHRHIQDRKAERERALLVAAEQAEVQRLKREGTDLTLIEAQIRADHAANEAAKTLEMIRKKGRGQTHMRIYANAPPEFLPPGVENPHLLFDAMRRRGVPVVMTHW